MTWDEIMQMLANVLADNVVDAYEYGSDVYSKDDIQHLIESEFQNMIENIEFGIGMYIVGVEKRIREKLGVSE